MIKVVAILLVILVTISATLRVGAPRPWTSAAGAPQRTNTFAVPRLRAGLDANPKAASDYRRDSWLESIRLMRTTSANNFHVAKVWTELEPTPGAYRLDELALVLEQSAPLAVAFNLRVIDAGARNMPEPYKALPWDSPEMIGHLSAIIGRLAEVLGHRPWSYAIGNEIDMYFGTRPHEIAAYARMLQQIRPRVRAAHPNARVTTSFQASAVPQVHTLYAAIAATVDHVAVSYYPLSPDYRVRPPHAAATELPALVAAAAPLPVYFQEIGYPSSSLVGSSPEMQAEFVRIAFETIRSIGSPRVLGATYLFQADLPEWLIDLFATAYRSNDRHFRAFVGTLGLRDERDRPKPAWDEFMRQAQLIAPNRRR